MDLSIVTKAVKKVQAGSEKKNSKSNLYGTKPSFAKIKLRGSVVQNNIKNVIETPNTTIRSSIVIALNPTSVRRLSLDVLRTLLLDHIHKSPDSKMKVDKTASLYIIKPGVSNAIDSELLTSYQFDAATLFLNSGRTNRSFVISGGKDSPTIVEMYLAFSVVAESTEDFDRESTAELKK